MDKRLHLQNLSESENAFTHICFKDLFSREDCIINENKRRDFIAFNLNDRQLSFLWPVRMNLACRKKYPLLSYRIAEITIKMYLDLVGFSQSINQSIIGNLFSDFKKLYEF